MCGIAGMVGRADGEVVARMTDLQAHRGPNDAGVEVLESHHVALGHRRLSIIDLSEAGHQPMCNGSRDLWITFNGEIYNYREVREDLIKLGYRFRSSTDTEVLLLAYECWGERCLERLNGMFAFAIYDCRLRRLFAARDRLGVKPFYYFEGAGMLVFASEIKALFACPQVPKRPDLVSLATPARYQVPPDTGFEHIRKLPPGHLLIYSDGRASVRPYWMLEVSEETNLSDDQAIGQLDDLMQQAVERQMIADVPVGLLLSGGVDSSVIAALMRRQTAGEVHAFTIRYADEDQQFERMPNDSHYARRVARELSLEYHEIEIKPRVEELLPRITWHLDEPLSDPAALNTYLIARAARERGIPVLLNGMGGDEIFGGYRKHLACLRAEQYQQVVPRVVQRIIEKTLSRVPVATGRRGLRTFRWAKRFFSFASLPQMDRYLASDLSLSQQVYERLYRGGVGYRRSRLYEAQRELFENRSASYLTRMCLGDTNFFLPELNLLYSDKATMAAGVEGRPPLTDHNVVQFMFSRPPMDRIRGNQQKYLLKRVAEKYLPHDIVHRPKAPFGSPLRSWVRGPLANMVDEILAQSAMRTSELYEPSVVRDLIARDRAGVDDNALVIWTILTNEIWFRTWFGASTTDAACSDPARLEPAAG